MKRLKEKYKKQVLVTGGAGYIGSTVSHDLIKAGHKVTIIDNLSTGFKKLIPKKATFIKSDINNIKILKKLFRSKKFDLVMHFAAYIKVDESVKKPKKYIQNNFTKTKIFLEYCLKNNLNKIIFSSTASVYGNKFKKIKEKDALLPSNPYALSKMKCENFIMKRRNKNNFKYIILRYFNVAGSPVGLETGMITKKATHLIKKLCEFLLGTRKKFYIFGNNYPTKDGTAIRDFIHVSDLSKLHILSMNYLIKRNKSQIFNCGYGREFSVLEIVKAAFKSSKKKLNYKFSGRRKGDVAYAVADNSKIKKLLKFKPRYSNINFIINTAFKWEKKIYNNPFY